MTIIIDKTNSENIAKILTDKFRRTKEKGNLAKHFGKLKRNLDGLNFQVEIRKDEDSFIADNNSLFNSFS